MSSGCLGEDAPLSCQNQELKAPLLDTSEIWRFWLESIEPRQGLLKDVKGEPSSSP